jgi:hypothetical protein
VTPATVVTLHRPIRVAATHRPTRRPVDRDVICGGGQSPRPRGFAPCSSRPGFPGRARKTGPGFAARGRGLISISPCGERLPVRVVQRELAPERHDSRHGARARLVPRPRGVRLVANDLDEAFAVADEGRSPARSRAHQ